jgi:hypothetical protein
VLVGACKNEPTLRTGLRAWITRVPSSLARYSGRGNETRTYDGHGVPAGSGNISECPASSTCPSENPYAPVEQPPYACVYFHVRRVVSDSPGGLLSDADLAGGAVPGKALPGENARRRAVEDAGGGAPTLRHPITKADVPAARDASRVSPLGRQSPSKPPATAWLVLEPRSPLRGRWFSRNGGDP